MTDHGRVWITEQLPVAQRDTGEQVHRVPEQRGLRRRVDEQLPIDPVGLEYSMQCPDLRSSCSGRLWMIVGCCFCRRLYQLVRWLLGLTAVLVRRDLSKDAELLVLRHENTVLR
ncbi:MAG TPA: hypothetical protein VJT72_02090 [Pseudonocardiaceae bacterium]|nr:hypothetical protein [Pseudonocardiaceae bacterium]